MATLIALPFAVLEGAERTPNNRWGSAQRRLDTYYRCIVTAFASFRRWAPEAQLLLVSNVPAREPHGQALRHLGVGTTLVPFTHRPPHGYAEQWVTSMYMLDVIGALQGLGEWEQAVVIDPDVVALEGLETLLATTAGSVGGYVLGLPPDQDMNGLTRAAAAEIHRELDGRATDDPPLHYGGEILVLPRWALPLIVERCERGWQASLRRASRGAPRFTTEEHVLSYALTVFDVADLGSVIRRIWTGSRFREVFADDLALSLWHLPAEKTRGFSRLHPQVLDPSSWWWSADIPEFRRRLGRTVGIPRRTPGRVLEDQFRRAASGVARTAIEVGGRLRP